MKILLVSSSKTMFGFDRFARLPNLGLCSIVANYECPDDEIRILDLVTKQKNSRQIFLDVLNDYSPDLVGLSCMIFQYDEIAEFSRLVKKKYPHIITLLGGYYATTDYQNILSDAKGASLDYLLRNECEITFNQFVDCLKNNRGFENIPGLSYRIDNHIHHNPSGELLDMLSIKIPDRAARIIKKGFHIMGYPADVVETSRGCPNDCDFCCITQMYGTKYRTYKIERVLEDIRDAKKHGAKAILFADDNITIDGKRYGELCEAIIKEQLNHLFFFTQASVDGLYKNPGLIEKMAQSGVKVVFLGIENIIEENLSIAGPAKRNKIQITENVLKDLRKHKILVIGSFIIGNPEDTKETIYQNYEFAQKFDIDIPLFLLLTPFPNTRLREDMIQKGLITNYNNYSEYNMFSANVRTHYLSSEELFNLREEISFKIFRNPRRLLRIIRLNPLWFLKMILVHIWNHPSEITGYIKGMFD